MNESLIVSDDGHEKRKFRDPLHKSKALTFSSLYVAQKETKGKESTTIKADRNILQRLITAYDAGRKVDLHNILQYELINVPIALAHTNGSLRTGNKAIPADVLSKDVTCPPEITLAGRSCLVIDGQALVVPLGKTKGVTNFGELANVFVKLLFYSGRSFDRIDVTFDRYKQTSIKSGTRKKLSKHSRLIRRVVEDTSVPIPNNWQDFLAVPANKGYLAEFLSKQPLETIDGKCSFIQNPSDSWWVSERRRSMDIRPGVRYSYDRG